MFCHRTQGGLALISAKNWRRTIAHFWFQPSYIIILYGLFMIFLRITFFISSFFLFKELALTVDRHIPSEPHSP